MSCVDLQYISSDECIGASLPKINGNFAALSAAVCELSSAPAVDASVNVFDSPTIDLDWNASTRTLSASLSSISSFFTGTNQSLLSSGYQKLPGGLIIQWSSFNTGIIGNTATGAQTFPISFLTSALQVIVGSTSGVIGVNAVNDNGLHVTALSASGFSWVSTWSNGRDDTLGFIRYIALGY